MSALEQKWNQIVIPDFGNLSGKSVAKLIENMNQIQQYPYVMLDEIEALGPLLTFTIFADLERIVLKTRDLIYMLSDVDHFEWGSFFLFHDYPHNWVDSSDYFDPVLVEQTNATIRAVDDNYLYVYTPSDDVCNHLQAKYTVESVVKDLLENLDYPY